MLRNYLLIAYRNLLRHKVFSLINISGLAIGMAACFLILQYISYEGSYDRFYEKGEQIYRLRFDRYRNGSEDKSIGIAPGIGPALKAQLPEVVNFLRLKDGDYLRNIVGYGDRRFNQDKVFFADSSFFSFFPLPLLKGQPEATLRAPNTALITESVAIRYFGAEDPLGKMLSISNSDYGTQPYMVTGVLKNLPNNTHLDFQILLSFSTLDRLDEKTRQEIGWNSFFTYLLLNPKADREQFQNKLDQFTQELLGEAMKELSFEARYTLQPLHEIHLYPEFVRQDLEVKGNKKSLSFLLLIAIIILLIAYVNYINLSTSRTIERAKEVGIRKVLGSGRGQLIRQFLLESVLLNLIAVWLAFTLLQLATPAFNQFTGKDLSFSTFQAFFGWQRLVAVLTVGAVLSGLYPALVLSSFKPASALKSKNFSTLQGIFLRKGLVVGQFAATVALIAGTLAVYRQLDFMREKDLGISLEETVVLKAPGDKAAFAPKVEAFKTELLQHPSIKSISASTSVPGKEVGWVTTVFRKSGEIPNNVNSYTMHFVGVDQSFLDAFEINLLAGRKFSEDFPTDKNAVVLSETAVKSLGYKSPQEALNQKITEFGEQEYTVVGITRDYHQNSLKVSLAPIAFVLAENQAAYYSVKVAAENQAKLREVLSLIEAKWKAFYPEYPFDYFFLDDYFNQQYKSDQQFGTIFASFAGLAIFVACLGLFGLASFNITQRTKEIGVRKVLGASISQIMALLSRDFLKLVLLANLLAWPMAWWGVREWLQEYPFRIGLSSWFFLLPSGLVLLIALLTVSGQTWRAARANPVESLRSE